MKWVYVLGIILAVVTVALVLPDTTKPLPFGECHYKRPYLPDNWWVMEAPECLCGTMCRKDGWVPRLTIGGSLMEERGIWVFGVTTHEEEGGILHFREYPDTDCVEHCVGCTPVLYEAEVIYVPYYGDPVYYSPYHVPVTYIPPGQYIVTSPSFHISNGVEIWYFYDDGNGPVMNAHLETDKPHYGKDECPVFTLTIIDQLTGNPIKVDGITGEIVLPDRTKKTLTTGMWVWNEGEKSYTCQWDLKNDDGNFSNPREGGYLVQITARKHLYKDASASSDFMVCYNVQFELKFDKNPPQYSLGQHVSIMVTITEDGNPLSGILGYELASPEGGSESLEWEETLPGVYHASYLPLQPGKYIISVWLQDDFGACYLGEASSSFEVLGEGEFECPFSEEESKELALMYSPYMYFYKGFWGEEKYFPASVEVMLMNSTFWEFELGRSKKIDNYDKSAEFIKKFTDPNHYLDLNSKSCVIDSDLVDEQGEINVYYRVVCHRYQERMYIVIQYQFFYIFNDHFFPHEGDWEMIEVLLDYETREPVGVAYARHKSGEYRPWEDMEKEGTHPRVYIAKGSHAAYFEGGIHAIQILNYPFLVIPADFTSNNGEKALTPHLHPISENSGPPWLYFGGNWGYRIGASDEEDCSVRWISAPDGPLYNRETWVNPVGWALSHYNNKSEKIHSPYTLFSLSCPADMLITNSAGQRLGYINGNFVQEIPNSYVQNLSEEEAYVIAGTETYKIEVSGTGDGVFNLACSINLWDRTTVIQYRDVPVTLNTKAVLDLESDLLLKVDTDQDGITDFTVSPISMELSSSNPIQPLQRGTDVIYELLLENKGDPSTFSINVEVPPAWSYTLSETTVMLHAGESATVLLTVTSPAELLEQDYDVHVDAFCLENCNLTASMDLIASFSSELAVEDIGVLCNQEDVILTAAVSNMGLIDAAMVTIYFYCGLPCEGNLLGEQLVTVPSGKTTFVSLGCSLPEGFYTFSAVVDPTNDIPESCEFNNELQISYLLDHTPPECEIFFDPESQNLTIRGIDNLDSAVDISVMESEQKGKKIQVYTLIDDTKNATEITLEIIHNNHPLESEITGLKYNGEPATLPSNSLKIEYVVENNSIKILNQYLTIEKSKVHLIYNGNKDETRVIMNGKSVEKEGCLVLVVRTDKGNLLSSIENVRWTS
ncbi:MAG: CARDB domain-containing protein [Candidatus Methanofastidiosia archaeon]